MVASWLVTTRAGASRDRSYSLSSFPTLQARDFPSGAKASESSRPLSVTVRSNSPEARSHSRHSQASRSFPPGRGQSCPRWNPQSQLPLASVLPSGEKAIVQTQPPWPARDRRSRPVAVSQSRTSLSPLPLDSVELSGEKASAETLNGWFFIWCRSLPVARSQTRICLSAPAEASSLPSGERAAAYASHSVWPASVWIRFPDL